VPNEGKITTSHFLMSLSDLAGLMISAAVPAAAKDKRVADCLKAQGIKYDFDADGDFKITCNYSKERRTQLVFVSGKTEMVGG